MTRFAAILGASLLPAVASAHPDHVSESAGHTYGLAHLLTDPFHVGLAVVAVALAFGLRRALARRAWSAGRRG
jgi:hydrogenase/urease accessory protein HupE